MNTPAESLLGQKYLSQRLLGENWSNYIGCSRFSVFWRMSRLNHLTSTEVHSTLGVRVGKHEDAFEKLTHTTIAPNKMVRLSYGGEIDPSFWSLDYWWPFAGGIPWKSMPWRIRVCPACARSCYHSMLFQVPGIDRCPWHRVALIDACRCCKRQFFNGLNDGGLLGVCRCGHDLVDYKAAILGDGAALEVKQEALASLGAWARSGRSANLLISPVAFDPFAWRALHASVPPLPRAMQFANAPNLPGNLIVESISFGRLPNQRLRLCAYDISREFRGSFCLSLPLAWQETLTRILTNLFCEVSTAERMRMASDARMTQAIRDLSTFAGIDCIHLPTQHIQQLTLNMLSSLDLTMRLGSLGTAQPLAGTLVRHLFQRVLFRGYAAAVRAVLAPQLMTVSITTLPPSLQDEHAPYRGAADEVLPHFQRIKEGIAAMRRVRYPWVLLRLPCDRHPSAQITWTLQS